MYSVSREMTGAFSDWGGWGGGGVRIFFNTIGCYVLAKSLKLCSISTFEQPIHAGFGDLDISPRLQQHLTNQTESYVLP